MITMYTTKVIGCFYFLKEDDGFYLGFSVRKYLSKNKDEDWYGLK